MNLFARATVFIFSFFIGLADTTLGCGGDRNAVFLECGPSCQRDFCQTTNYRKVPCVDRCLTGCFCQCGFARDEASQICVPTSCCPTGFENVDYYQKCPSVEINIEFFNITTVDVSKWKWEWEKWAKKFNKTHLLRNSQIMLITIKCIN